MLELTPILGGQNLDMIRPDRAYIVNVLTQAEQFDAAGHAAAEPQQPRHPDEPNAKRSRRG